MSRKTGVVLLLIALVSMAILALRTQPVLSQAARLDLTPDGGSTTAGTAFTITITAYLSDNSVDTTYTGTVHFSSSDSIATLPADYPFTESDNGTHTFTDAITLRSSGSQIVTVTDTVNGSLTNTETWSVTAATTASLDLTPNGGSITAGSPFTVTVTAYDAYGNIATGYLGTVRFTSSDPSATLPADYTFTAPDNGSHTFTSAVTLRTSGNRTVTATDTVNGSLTNTETWSVTAAATASLDLTPNGGSVTAGSPFTVTVTAYDAYGNIATGYLGTVRFTSSDPSATLPADYTFTAPDNGSHTFTSAVTLRTSGNRTVTATDTVNGSLTNTETWSVTAAATASLDLTPNGGSVTAGSPFTVTVTAYDAYGNIATGYLGTVRFTSSDPSATLPADYTFTAPDNGSHTFTSAVTLRTSGNRTVTATDTVNGSLTNTETWSVTAAATASLDLTPNGGSVTAGSPFTVTVTAYDAYGNIATGYLGTVRFTSSDPSATLPADYTFTAPDNGSHTFTSAVTLRTSGNRTVTATDTVNGSLTNTETWSVTAAATASLDLTPNGGSVTAGSPFTVTVTAYDAYGNIATGYLGTVRFTSSDPSAALPADYAFTAPDNGAHVFAVSMSTSGSQTITVTDTGNAALTNTESWSVSVATIHHYAVTSASYSQTAGVPFTVTVTAYDSFGNVVNTDNSTSVTMTSSSGTMLFDGNSNGTFGEPGDNVLVLSSGTFNISARDTTAASGVTITATDGNSVTGNSNPYAIAAGTTIAHYTVTSASYSQAAGVPFIVTVTARDSFSNVVTTDNSTSVTMTSSSATMLFDGNGNSIFGEPGDNVLVLSSGTFNISSRDTAGASSVTITATDANSMTGNSNPYTITAGTTIAYYTVTSGAYSQSAGVPFIVTVTAYDSFGNVVTTDNSTSVTMTSSSGTMLFDGNGNGTFGEPGDNVLVLSSGTFSIPARDTVAAGSVTITATDGNSMTGNSSPYTIAAAAIAHYTVTSASYSQTSGVPFIVTVTAYDSFGNVVSTDNSTSVTMTSSSGTMLFDGNSNGTFGEPGDNILVLSSGTFNISARDTTPGTGITVSATDGNSMTGNSSPYTIAAAAIAYYTVTSASYSQSAGVPFIVTVTAYDSFGNVVTTDNSTSVTMTSISGTMLFDGNGNGTFGEPGDNVLVLSSGTFNISARDTTAASGVTITATDGNSNSGTSDAYSIAAAAIAYYTVTSTSYTQTAGVPFTVTVTTYDSFGNVVTTDNSTSVTMTSSSGTMLFDGNGNGTFGEPGDNVLVLSSGTFSISARDSAAGSGITIAATDGNSVTATSSPYTITAGAIDHYTVTSEDYTQQTTVSFTVTVTAYDAFGNPALVDGLAVTMSSTSSALVFDGNGNGTFGEAGDDVGVLVAGTFDIRAKFKSTAESVTITATDADLKAGYSEPYAVEDFRCFIATAAYGTPMIDQIQVLRDFRDQYLMKTPAGRWFVSTYYRYSPPLARFIARHDSLRGLVRACLTPVIWLTTLIMNTTLTQKLMILLLILTAFIEATSWIRRRRRPSAA